MNGTATIDDRPSPSKRKQLLRLGLVGTVILGLFLIGKLTGLNAYVTPNRIQQLLLGCGVLGVLGFIAAFSAGLLMWVPGMIFVAASVFTYGQLVGGLIGLVGAVIATIISFLVFRRLGGQPLGEIRHPLMKRLLGQLETRPVRAMIVLRSLFFISPPLNSALALSNIRLRDYALGSTLGLVLPITVATLLIDRVIKWIS